MRVTKNARRRLRGTRDCATAIRRRYRGGNGSRGGEVEGEKEKEKDAEVW